MILWFLKNEAVIDQGKGRGENVVSFSRWAIVWFVWVDNFFEQFRQKMILQKGGLPRFVKSVV